MIENGRESVLIRDIKSSTTLVIISLPSLTMCVWSPRTVNESGVEDKYMEGRSFCEERSDE